MPSKKFRRTILFILLLSIIYNLLRTSSPWGHPSKAKNTNTSNKTSPLPPLGTHVPMPSRFKGKAMPFHRVFEPREIGFPKDLLKPQNSNKTKLILVWTSWNRIKKTINYYFLRPGNKTFKRHNCPNSNCVATFNRDNLLKADAVLFHLIDIKLKDMPPIRTPEQVWIVYNMEPPWLVQRHLVTPMLQLRNVFNWTMGYKSNSNIVVRYGYISKVNETTQVNETKLGDKMVAWFVSDCNTDSKREDYVSEMQKHIDVDIYGRCGNKKCYPSQSSICYETVLKNYKFYLSFENAICEDYVTEKYFNVFNYDIIPVVFGGANYSSIVPLNSYIDATEFPQPKMLAETLLNLASSDEKYLEYLKRKQGFKAYLDPWMCKLCNKLHVPIEKSTLESVDKWIFGDAQCKNWNKMNKSFINKE
ncbi:glycoprotein 3-alpha-L-fucosyltransferase A-like [Parasteatoda tepidariorum]|uniref:glycoprotein 3-alpha-L-fucosyltransferase A-like n=1 Tax=Parasteatoda tepidariorum TaxID=114398 RepID=UPI00077FCE7F|nr:glycoprotein 3-alpha-L-fucosyltransferase A-like [Parasteatoda tepidariorum]